MELFMHVEGASPTDRARGVAAAQAVFDRAKVTPYQCALAVYNRNCWDDRDFVGARPSDEEMDHAALWDEAESAGLAACMNGNGEAPSRACLKLTFDDSVFVVD